MPLRWHKSVTDIGCEIMRVLFRFTVDVVVDLVALTVANKIYEKINGENPVVDCLHAHIQDAEQDDTECEGIS